MTPGAQTLCKNLNISDCPRGHRDLSSVSTQPAQGHAYSSPRHLHTHFLAFLSELAESMTRLHKSNVLPFDPNVLTKRIHRILTVIDSMEVPGGF